jgi:hypothetical protein
MAGRRGGTLRALLRSEIVFAEFRKYHTIQYNIQEELEQRKGKQSTRLGLEESLQEGQGNITNVHDPPLLTSVPISRLRRPGLKLRPSLGPSRACSALSAWWTSWPSAAQAQELVPHLLLSVAE